MATPPADLVNSTANPPANPNAWISAFRKRQLTMFRKAYATQELNSGNIRVYLVVERTDNNSMHYWNSETDVDWLPTSDNVSRHAKFFGPDEMAEFEQSRPRRARRRNKQSSHAASRETAMRCWDSDDDDDDAVFAFNPDCNVDSFFDLQPTAQGGAVAHHTSVTPCNTGIVCTPPGQYMAAADPVSAQSFTRRTPAPLETPKKTNGLTPSPSRSDLKRKRCEISVEKLAPPVFQKSPVELFSAPMFGRL